MYGRTSRPQAPRPAAVTRGGVAGVRSAYRAQGADAPFSDARAHHGVAFEGYFWRVTDPGTGGVVVALLGICRDRDGRSWATAALAGHPGGVVRRATLDRAAGDPARLALHGATADGRSRVHADERRVTFALGEDAHLTVEVERPVRWPRRALGGTGPAQVVPGLSQYWHPWLLDGTARGSARLGERTWNLDGARVYAEKNWGGGGFPAAWWWGQAHGFAREDATVAFAGGRAGLGPLRLTATSVIVRAGREVVRLTRPPGLLRADTQQPGRWHIAGRTARHTLELEGHAVPAEAHRLPVPLPAQRRELPEGSAQHLAGELRVLLRRGRRTILDDTSHLAGLELGRGT